MDGQEQRFSLVYPEWQPPEIDTTVAHPARRYDYWLGGKDNYPADRESGDTIAALFPAIPITAVENRRFMCRVVEFLTREVGIRQFLDIGTGIPTSPNAHQVAQSIAPESRIVYVDNDPIVLAHARALLTSTLQGAPAYIHADLREPDKIRHHPDLLEVLDLSRPTALMLVAILHFVKDADDPYGAVGHLVEAMAPGSYLVISHATNDHMPRETAAAVDAADSARRVPFQFRTREQFAASSAGWSCWSRASCRCPSGVPSTSRCPARPSRTPPCTARWRGSDGGGRHRVRRCRRYWIRWSKSPALAPWMSASISARV